MDMAKRNISSFTGWLLVILLLSCPSGWSEGPDSGELEEKLRRAEESYSEGNYSTAKEIFTNLHHSFPTDSRSSYLQFMIAKCDYHLGNHTFAEDKFKEFIDRFPRSKFTPAGYFFLGNIAYLKGAVFQATQYYIYAYQLARTQKLKSLVKASLDPLLQKWLSAEELEKLSRTNREGELAPDIFFYLGKRYLKQENLKKAKEVLSFYRDNYPEGNRIQEVRFLLQEATKPDRIIKVGILTPLSGDFSFYGTSLLNGVKLALSLHPPTQRKIVLEIKDTEGDFVKAALYCSELIYEDSVTCVIGPLRSESVASAAVVANKSQIPLITPTASKEGLASLGDFVFQLSPSPESKGRNLAEFVVRYQKLKDFIILLPEGEQEESEALAFMEMVEQLGGRLQVIQYYPPGTTDFSPYLREIKNVLLGYPPSQAQDEDGSFFDQIPVWVEGFFVSADQNEMYDILSHIANLNIYATVIATEGCGDKQVLEFAKNIDRGVIFSSASFPREDNPLWEDVSEIYSNKYEREADQVSMLGYDSMCLLLSILEKFTSPENIRDALLSTHDFKGAAGDVDFDAEGENNNIPIYKLENGVINKVR
jgi:ABC-type branched-subunit amino acid transport system substrate-binding protein